ncbi:hypothetical protein MAR_028411, partial [Mya arenaria]
GFKTKATLKEEDVALTKQVKEIERCYRHVYKFVYQLDITYQSCMEPFALPSGFQDKGDAQGRGCSSDKAGIELKDMIKACITDEEIAKTAKYRATNSPQETGRATNSPQETGRAVRLHTAAQRLYEASARD